MDDSMRREADLFLDEVYALLQGEPDPDAVDHAIDRIFDHLDRLQIDGNFALCNTILERCDMVRLKRVRRSILVITKPSGDRGLLPSWEACYRRASDALRAERGEDAVLRILGPLATPAGDIR